MFSFGRRQEVSPTQQVLKLSLSSPKASGVNNADNRSNNRKNRPGSTKNGNGHVSRGRRKGSSKQNSWKTKPVFHDTGDGVEISLKGGGPASPLESRDDPPLLPFRPEAVVPRHIEQKRFGTCKKMQFSTQKRATSKAFETTENSNIRPNRRAEHRIPLSGRVVMEAPYDDVLQLLQHSGDVISEEAAVQQELNFLNQELEALQRDQKEMGVELKQKEEADFMTALRSPKASEHSASVTEIQDMLDEEALTDQERVQLQNQRGSCLTAHIEHDLSRESFLRQCGAQLANLLRASSGSNPVQPPPGCLTLGPHNCRVGGAATQLRQIQCLGRNSFWMSRDTGKPTRWGKLPQKLYERLKRERMVEHDIVQLNVGYKGAYVCRFQSGVWWWGVASDSDLVTCLQEWDVHNVVLGPMVTREGISYLSWMVVSKTGQVAWKNIPSSLEKLLQSRLVSDSTITSVTFDLKSYFVRFGDGTVDYALPADMADVCGYIEKHGGTITELIFSSSDEAMPSNDFILRHTELR